MAKPEQEQTIEDTLRLLHIEADATPEEAAAAAGERVARSGGNREDDERIAIPSPTDDDGEEDDDDEDEVEADEPRPARRTAASRLDEPSPSLIPTPKIPRPKARINSPGTSKMGKGLAGKLPGAEKVKVYKRELGNRWFVQDYSAADLANFSDFESFITHYVKPEHGAGEYDLVGVDGLGRDIEAGTVRIKETKTPTAEASITGLFSEMMRQQADRDKEYLNRMNMMQQQPPQKDPLELLAGVLNLKKQLDEEAGHEASSVAQAAKANASESLQMMMLMLTQQQQAADRQMQTMLALMTKPKEESPFEKFFMMKMMKDMESGVSGGVAPPPPPPPAEQPNMVEMLKGLSEVMVNLAPGGGGDDDFKEFLKQMMLKTEAEKLSIKDIIALMKGDPDKPGTDDFRKSIDNMASIMNVAQSLNKGQEAGPAAGLFDALAALFSNRDFAGSIANTIRAKTDQSGNAQAQQIAAERQRLEMVQRNVRRESALLQQQQLAAGHPPHLVPPQAATPTVIVQPQGVVVEAAVFDGTTTVATQTPTPEQVQQAVSRTIESQGKIPQLPAQTHEHISRIAAAKDDAELVSRTVDLLIYFAESEDWRGFSEQLLGFVRAGDKRSTLQYLRTFFGALTDMQMLPLELTQRILKAVTENLGALQAQLMDFKLTGDDTVTADDLLATPG